MSTINIFGTNINKTGIVNSKSYINVFRNEVAGDTSQENIRFEDPNCKALITREFGENGEITYARAAEISTESFNSINVTNSSANSSGPSVWDGIKKFNEFKYFIGVKKIFSELIETNTRRGGFRAAKDLEEIELPSTLEELGVLAFAMNNNNGQLKRIEIPAGCVISPGSSCFYGCSNMTEIIYNSDTFTGENCKGVFRNCISLTSSFDVTKMNNIGSRLFENCPSITGVIDFTGKTKIPLLCLALYSGGIGASIGDLGIHIIIPSTIQIIEDRAFVLRKNSTFQADFSNCTSIGYNAFFGCTNLQLTDSAQLSKCVSIGELAFATCKNFLNNINLLDLTSAKTIGRESLFSTEGTSRIYNKNSAITIKFGNALEQLSFPVDDDSVTFADWQPFWVGKYIIPTTNTHYKTEDDGQTIYSKDGSVLVDGADTMAGELRVKDGTKIIRAACFRCNGGTNLVPGQTITIGLTSIVLPSSLIKIQDRVFQYSKMIRSIISYATTPPAILFNTAFSNISTSIQEIKVPANSVNAYKNASGWSRWASVIKSI
jgi:hypothetical protein